MKNILPSNYIENSDIEKVREYVVTKRDIKRFAQAISNNSPLYYDEEYSKTTIHKSIIAPPLFTQAFAFEDVPLEELLPDGSPVEINIPLPAKRLIGGGSIYEIFNVIKPGDTIKVKTKTNEIYKKMGKSELLYFIVIETIFYNEQSHVIAKETATFIKR